MSTAPRPIALSALARRGQDRPPPRRYLFERDFDAEDGPPSRAPLPAPPPEPEVIAPSFSAAELAEARAKGVAEGRAAAAAEAKASAEARAAAALEAIAARLAEAREAAAAAAERAAGALARATLDLVTRALPSAAAAHAPKTCGMLAEALIARLSGVERIVIRLEPELARRLEPALARAAAAADFAGRLEVVGTAGMSPGEMRVSWPGGEARHDPHALASAARDVLHQLGLSPESAEENQDGS